MTRSESKAAAVKGFTLIEIAISISLALVAAGVVVHTYGKAQQQRRNVESASYITQAQQAIRQRYFGLDYSFTPTEGWLLFPDKIRDAAASNFLGFLPNGARIDVSQAAPGSFIMNISGLSAADCTQLMPQISPQFNRVLRLLPNAYLISTDEGNVPSPATVSAACNASDIYVQLTSL